MTLRDIILDEIRRRGPIPFSRYMELCLYHPELGYYARAREQFGKTGDFYTSSDVHAVFGRLLARQFDDMWRALDAPATIRILEFGPGRGLFAQDVLDWAHRKFPDFLAALRYVLIESSPALRARLEERFREQITAGRVAVYGSIEEAPSTDNTILFANEFFDALPAEVIADKGALRIGEESGRFVEQFAPPSAEELEFLDRYSVHPEDGERVEAPLAAQDYMKRVAATIARGFAVIIDYGYTRNEQLAGRHRDTIMAYRAHTASADPYEAPGEQDITAHVNFTALSAAGQAASLQQVALLTQSQFLLGIGEPNQFADAFADCKLPQEQTKVALQLKHLATPAGMGETFQVLLMSRGVEREKAAALSGMRFAH
jgi:SAM-dependent MidA family methyltransferase